MDVLQMRPLLLRDAYFLPLDGDGLYMRSSHRVMTIADVPVFPWIERLAPYLTGKNTLGELTRSLPESKRRLVCDLVRVLYEHGMVRDATEGQPHTLRQWEQDTYEAEIAYLETYADSPEHRFQRYREQYVLVIGAGLLLEAAVNATLRSGVRRVRALLTPESFTDHDRLFEHVASAKARDPEHVFELDLAPEAAAGHSVWANSIRGHDAVLHVAERPMMERLRLVDGACDELGVLLVQGVVLPDEAWVGAVAAPGRADTRWLAAWRRVRVEARPGVTGDVADQPSVESAYFTGAVPAIAANTTVFHLFTHVTGTSEHDWTQHLTRLDLETLETSVHRFHPHPLAMPASARSAAALRARIRDLQGGEEQDDETLSRAAVAYVDRRVGVFGSIDEEACGQSPLWVTRVTLAEPVAADGRDLAVAAGALEFAQARRSAIRRATELYAALMFDPRQAVGTRHEVWGLRLEDDQPVLVGAERVFATAAQARAFGLPTGVASGSTWQGAVAAGLLGWCELLTGQEAIRRGRHTRLAREALADDALGDHLGVVLDLTESEPAILDLTGSLGVPTFACRLGERVLSIGSGLDAAAAVRRAMERALLVWQLGAGGHATDTCLPGPHLAGWRTAGQEPLRSELPEPVCGDDPARALAERLEAAGHRPVVVPLDVDPHLARLAPYLVRVVLTDA